MKDPAARDQGPSPSICSRDIPAARTQVLTPAMDWDPGGAATRQRARRRTVIRSARVYDAKDRGDLTEDEVAQIERLDLMVGGRDKTAPDGPDTVVAVEISSTIDYEDVDRARDRAALLAKTGLRSRAGVAGHDISSAVQRFADEHSVLVRIVSPSELPR